jgi:hypothetical protein
MQNGGQPYGQQYGQTQQPPMWSSAAPTQPQFGSMGMQNMQQPMWTPTMAAMSQQPTNNYYSTYNQPMSQDQPRQSGGLLEPTAPVADTAPKPATPSPVATQPTNTNSNVTSTVNSMQSQAQNPVAPPQPAYTPTQPAYTPPQPAYTPQPAASQPAYNNNPAVNGIVPRPEGVPDYTRDYTAAPGSMGSVLSTLRGMQQEVSPTNYNLSPDAPLMNQGQQNLVNMGLDPMIARIYGSRG